MTPPINLNFGRSEKRGEFGVDHGAASHIYLKRFQLHISLKTYSRIHQKLNETRNEWTFNYGYHIMGRMVQSANFGLSRFKSR